DRPWSIYELSVHGAGERIFGSGIPSRTNDYAIVDAVILRRIANWQVGIGIRPSIGACKCIGDQSGPRRPCWISGPHIDGKVAIVGSQFSCRLGAGVVRQDRIERDAVSCDCVLGDTAARWAAVKRNGNARHLWCGEYVMQRLLLNVGQDLI